MTGQRHAARSAARRAAADVIRAYLAASGQQWSAEGPDRFTVQLPGERKLATACSLAVGDHTVTASAFVARHADENHEAVYRWLLERNARLSGIAFAVDGVGDVYLVGRLPLAAVTADQVDRLLGAVVDAADSSFTTILELGFATSIRQEWAWRLSRNEPTHNLAAFEHLRPRE